MDHRRAGERNHSRRIRPTEGKPVDPTGRIVVSVNCPLSARGERYFALAHVDHKKTLTNAAKIAPNAVQNCRRDRLERKVVRLDGGRCQAAAPYPGTCLYCGQLPTRITRPACARKDLSDNLIGVVCRPHFWPRPRPLHSHTRLFCRLRTSAVACLYSGSATSATPGRKAMTGVSANLSTR